MITMHQANAANAVDTIGPPSKRGLAPVNDQASRFQAATDIAPAMMWMASSNGLRDWFNLPWLRFTGHSLGQQVGDGWLASVHVEDIARCVGIADVSFNARASFDMAYRLRRYDGAYRWVLDRGVPHHTLDGRFIGYVGCSIDIDERRAIEDRLALRTEALRLSERRRDAFLTAVVDELSASLAIARNNALALNGNACCTETSAAASRLIEPLRAQLSGLLGEAKRSARSVRTTGPSEGQRTSLGALLQRAVASVPFPLLRGNLTVRAQACDADQAILVDLRLGRVIGKLLETALEHAEARADLNIVASLDARSSAIALRMAAGGDGFSDAFLPLAIGYVAAQQVPPMNSWRASVNGPSLSGLSAFTEQGGRHIDFVIGPPWVAGPAP